LNWFTWIYLYTFQIVLFDILTVWYIYWSSGQAQVTTNTDSTALHPHITWHELSATTHFHPNQQLLCFFFIAKSTVKHHCLIAMDKVIIGLKGRLLSNVALLLKTLQNISQYNIHLFTLVSFTFASCLTYIEVCLCLVGIKVCWFLRIQVVALMKLLVGTSNAGTFLLSTADPLPCNVPSSIPSTVGVCLPSSLTANTTNINAKRS
jgi:hypothetical protein